MPFFSAQPLTAASPVVSGQQSGSVAVAGGGWAVKTDDVNFRQHLGRILFHLLILLSTPPQNLIRSTVDEKGLLP